MSKVYKNIYLIFFNKTNRKFYLLDKYSGVDFKELRSLIKAWGTVLRNKFILNRSDFVIFYIDSYVYNKYYSDIFKMPKSVISEMENTKNFKN
jgi:hypothetical protein